MLVDRTFLVLYKWLYQQGISNMASKRSDALRAKWMSAFEDTALKTNPEFSGKIDWTTAVYYYGAGLTTEEAAKRYIERYG